MTLSEYMIMVGDSQSDFADRLGVTQPTISRLLSGVRDPSLKLMQQIRCVTDMAVGADDILDSIFGRPPCSPTQNIYASGEKVKAAYMAGMRAERAARESGA